MSSKLHALPLLLLFLALPGCGSDDQNTSDPSLGDDGPLYVISTGIDSGDDFAGYLAVVPSLEAGTTFDLDTGLEIEASWIFRHPDKPYVYAASLFSATITRYVLRDDGKLEKDKVVDFSPYGLQTTYLAASAPFYSEEKSYFVDDSQNQIVIWSPGEMRALGTIPLPNEAENGLPVAPEGTLVEHDGLLLTAVDWSDWRADSSIYGKHTRLVALDPKTDAIVDETDDTRITYASPQAEGSDGTLYYSPASLIAAYRVIDDQRGSPSHVLRVKPTEKTFDTSYDLDLSTLVDGRPAGDFTLLDDETAIVRVWHSDLVDPVTPQNWQDVMWSQAGFLWWRWHVGDDEATQIPNQDPGALGASLIHVDGKTYVVRTAEDSSTSTLDEIGTQGEIRPALTGPGQFIGSGVVRLR